MKQWDADEALSLLTEQQRMLFGDASVNDPTQIREAVMNLFRESASGAAAAIVHCAMHSPNDRLRFDASKYVIDMATQVEGSDGDPLVGMVQEFMRIAQGAAQS